MFIGSSPYFIPYFEEQQRLIFFMDYSQYLKTFEQQQENLMCPLSIPCASPGCRSLSYSDQNGYKLCCGHMSNSPILPGNQDFNATTQFFGYPNAIANQALATTNLTTFNDYTNFMDRRNIMTSPRNYSLSHPTSLCRQPDCQDDFCNDCNHLKPQPFQVMSLNNDLPQTVQLCQPQSFLISNTQQNLMSNITNTKSLPSFCRQQECVNSCQELTDDHGHHPYCENNSPNLYNTDCNSTADQSNCQPLVQNQIVSPHQNIQIQQPSSVNPTNEFSIFERSCPNTFCDGLTCTICVNPYARNVYPTSHQPQQSQQIPLNNFVPMSNSTNEIDFADPSIPTCGQYGCRNPCLTHRNGVIFKFCSGPYCGATGITEQESEPGHSSNVLISPLLTHPTTLPVTANGTPAFSAAIPSLTMGMPTLTSGMVSPITAGIPTTNPLTIETGNNKTFEPESPIPSSTTTTLPATPTPQYESISQHTTISAYIPSKIDTPIDEIILAKNPLPLESFASSKVTSSIDQDVCPTRNNSICSSILENSVTSSVGEQESVKSDDENDNLEKTANLKPKRKRGIEKNIPARLCVRPGCDQHTMTKNKRAKRFDSYCSTECFWKEGETLSETKATKLDKNDSDHAMVYNAFRENLKNYRIKCIFRLQMPSEITNRYVTSKQMMAKANNVSPSAITRRLFHGTKSNCDATLIIKDGKFCTNEACGMCGIVAKSHKRSFSKCNGSMWFSESSATAQKHCSTSKIQAMFFVDVLTKDTEANVCVDQDELILPRFLILFGRN
ncbi:hypothetical protein G9A89_001859 [Geosiphon pyriformis]|nr:hypothetical protein G9A89_001859 [Geosiphon pyriformis]